MAPIFSHGAEYVAAKQNSKAKKKGNGRNGPFFKALAASQAAPFALGNCAEKEGWTQLKGG